MVIGLVLLVFVGCGGDGLCSVVFARLSWYRMSGLCSSAMAFMEMGEIDKRNTVSEVTTPEYSLGVCNCGFAGVNVGAKVKH